MMRLSSPLFTFEKTLEVCISGITGNFELRDKLISSKPYLLAEEEVYLTAASIGNLFTIPPINSDEAVDPVVINDLKKSELIKIYEQYFVQEIKPARKIYEALLNAAKEQCPFCGGIGTPRNLDHFLPKSHFPQFSVQPYNLIPSCRDCNMDGKAVAFATNEEDQIIQPYIDKSIFFVDQWIFAIYHPCINGDDGRIEYFVRPPDDWSDSDKKRAKKHFDDFGLARRYSTKSAEHLHTTLMQINKLYKLGLDSASIIDTILQPYIEGATFVNHWQVGMAQALINHIY